MPSNFAMPNSAHGGTPSAPNHAQLLQCSYGANSKGAEGISGSYPHGTCSSHGISIMASALMANELVEGGQVAPCSDGNLPKASST